MKKLTLLLIGIVLTLVTYSQDFVRIIRATKSEFQNEKWITILTDYPKDYFIIIKNDVITIGARKFKTYGSFDKTIYDNHVTYTWKCLNGNGDKCWFMMKQFKSEITTNLYYSIVYESGVMYEYEGE